MVNWADPQHLALQAQALGRMDLVLLGAFTWEYLQTLWFEWSLLARKVSFKWAYIPYFIGRYITLVLLATTVSLDTNTHPLNCAAAYRFVNFAGAVGASCATLNLLIRTLVLWRHNKWVRGVLYVALLGHWTLVFMTLVHQRAVWNPMALSCTAIFADRTQLLAQFLYTFIFDLVILILTLVALTRDRSPSKLWLKLYTQGIGYFFVASCASVAPAVLIIMALSPLMDIIAIGPALTISVIASSRAVLSLLDQAVPESTVDEESADPKLTTQLSLPSVYSQAEYSSPPNVLAGTSKIPEPSRSSGGPPSPTRSQIDDHIIINPRPRTSVESWSS